MKKIILFVCIYTLTFSYSFAETNDCNKFEKVSKEYAKCTSKLIKKRTSSKFKEGKKRFDKSIFKKQLLKFKNIKSMKEFIEK